MKDSVTDLANKTDTCNLLELPTGYDTKNDISKFLETSTQLSSNNPKYKKS